MVPSRNGRVRRTVPRCRLTQINLHRCQSAALAMAARVTAPAGTIVTHSKPHSEIFLIQEPYCAYNAIRGLPRGQLFAHSGNQCRPRACIWSSPNCTVRPLPQFTDPDLTAVITEWKDTKVVFASVYMAYDSAEHPSRRFEALVDHCKNQKLALIAGADANSHHTFWGSSDINLRGEKLMEFIIN